MDGNEKSANAYYNEKILTALVDIILEGSELDYRNRDLRISSEGDDSIITFVKTFYRGEYDNRLDQLLRELKEMEDEKNAGER